MENSRQYHKPVSGKAHDEFKNIEHAEMQ